MNIGIYIYDDAEVLDFSGPFEVLSTANRLGNKNWNVFLVSEKPDVVQARGGFPVRAHFSFETHPNIDVLIVAGGIHTGEVKKPTVISWISNVASTSKRVASVCTGAFILAEANLLNGLTVTTHWEDIADLSATYPKLNVVSDHRWVSQGKYITSGGISAGIDMSLHLVSELSTLNLAEQTAKQMEYHWQKCT
ncbi:DJ-1/PfpI family protein [Pseudoalteromonas sp. NZS11_1]|uniref:DJ-1/PfpI family protein n=1 Tax=Pseudoalteromonas sp. NZS11_1 TaxID=2792070 RepID=UPI0018CF4F39|nr:DJ-1/PfpI family protein [Pseudoalteromonas sp. NZS11_1]MBH0046539.1 DJ-1/PfpI family protein [Pseudoalteromonas sp. NZS11_1]